MGHGANENGIKYDETNKRRYGAWCVVDSCILWTVFSFEHLRTGKLIKKKQEKKEESNFLFLSLSLTLHSEHKHIIHHSASVIAREHGSSDFAAIFSQQRANRNWCCHYPLSDSLNCCICLRKRKSCVNDEKNKNHVPFQCDPWFTTLCHLKI